MDGSDAQVDVIFRGRAVIDGEVVQAGVGVRGGVIAWVEREAGHLDAGSRTSYVAGARGEARIVELTDDEVLLPGLVDTHVHVNEPGRTEWEGFASATRAAAAGGVTTIVDMPLNSVPPTTDTDALVVKQRATEGQRFVDVGFWGGAVPASLGQLESLHAQGVFGFKCFLLNSGVDEFPPLDSSQLDAAMREVVGFDGLLVVHAEDADTIAAAPPAAGASYARFLRSRPPEAEDRAIAEVLDLATRHGTRVHIVHLSNSTSLLRLAEARTAGVPVTVETCPHYLTLASGDIADGATQTKCCPPIRDRANQEALWQGLRDGVVDLVVSDHSPCTSDLKRLDTGDFGTAWGGVASVQLGLPLVWTAACDRGFGLGDLVRWMSTAPGSMAGLTGKGAIVAGADADLVVLAPDEQHTVDAARLHHRNAVTPYDGRRLRGVVRQTWLRGRQVAWRDTVDDVPTGQLLSRGGPTRV